MNILRWRPAIGGVVAPMFRSMLEPAIHENKTRLTNCMKTIVSVDKAVDPRQELLGCERLNFIPHIVRMLVSQTTVFHQRPLLVHRSESGYVPAWGPAYHPAAG